MRSTKSPNLELFEVEIKDTTDTDRSASYIERYILHMRVLLGCCYIKMESSQCENLNHLFCRKVSFLTDPHCRFRVVSQCMKQEATEPMIPFGKVEVITSKILRSPP
jgi:hypothetical protein